MEGKFAGVGLQNIDEDDDMLSAMARELVERNGIGETADAVWKALNAEHQNLFTASKSDGDDLPLELLDRLLPVQPNAAAVIKGAMDRSSVLIFGQRTGPISGRKSRSRDPVPEQASLF
jgi:hypothetical protein